jgi:hypothetical protein
MTPDGEFPSFWIIILPWVWILGWIVVSAFYRRSKGKAVLTRAPEDSLFVEKWTSGRELGGIRTLGGAKNCLIVAVTIDTLFVSPCFPFSLMFLPEIWGLEHRIRTRDIRSVDRRQGIFGSTQVVTFEGSRRLELRLRNPQGFERALKSVAAI